LGLQGGGYSFPFYFEKERECETMSLIGPCLMPTIVCFWIGPSSLPLRFYLHLFTYTVTNMRSVVSQETNLNSSI